MNAEEKIEKLRSSISSAFSGADVTYVGDEMERHNGSRRICAKFAVALDDEIVAQAVYFMNKGGGPFMRQDWRHGQNGAVSYYPRSYTKGNDFIIAVPEGCEEICLENLRKGGSRLQGILNGSRPIEIGKHEKTGLSF